MVIPELPAFAGDVKSETSLKTIMAAQYRTINRGGKSIFEELRRARVNPYVLRSHTHDYFARRGPSLVTITFGSTIYAYMTGSMLP